MRRPGSKSKRAPAFSESHLERSPAARLPVEPRSPLGLLAVLIVLVATPVAAVHWPALTARALAFDDAQYLTENRLVQDPSWASAGRFLREVLEPSTVGGYYQPLAMISLMLDYALGGRPENPRPFHRTSLVLHVGNTGLVIVLLYLLFGKPWVAALVGLLFGVHPLTVEPIPWIGERKTLLAAFFGLGSLIAYVSYTRRPGGSRYTVCLVLFVLALMSKPTTTPLPVLLLLLDYWPLRRLSQRTLREKVPLLFIAAVSAVITLISQSRTAATTMPTEYEPMRIPLVVCHNIIFYLYKIVWPTGLSSHYPVPDPLGLSAPMVLAGVIGTSVLLPALLISWHWTRALLVGWLLFFVAIFPTLGVIGFTNVIASDKFAYLPSVGLLLVLAWFLGKLWSRGPTGQRRTACQTGVVAWVVLLAAAEARATRRHLDHWQDTSRLWQHMLALAPRASSLHEGYASFFLMQQGRTDEAIAHYEEALHLDPHNLGARMNLGAALQTQNRLDEATGHYRQALELKPDLHKAHSNLGFLLVRQGKLDPAIEHFTQALESAPESALAHYGLAGALVEKGEIAEAFQHLNEALRLNPRSADAHVSYGKVLASQGRLDEALKHFAAAARLEPGWAEAHKQWGVVLALQGNLDEAITHYAEALRLDPNLADVHYNWANALVPLGQSAEAAAHYAAALQLKPEWAEVHSDLAVMLADQGRLDEALTHFAEAVQLKPDWPEGHKNLGVALTQRGQTDEGLRELRQSVRLAPNDADLRCLLGDLLRSLGRREEAVGEYRQALRLDPTHAGARHALETPATSPGRSGGR